MFSHIMVGANDIEKSKIFYDNLLGVLGAKREYLFQILPGQKRYFYFFNENTFCITEPIDGNAATPGMETQLLLMFLTRKLEINGIKLD